MQMRLDRVWTNHESLGKLRSLTNWFSQRRNVTGRVISTMDLATFAMLRISINGSTVTILRTGNVINEHNTRDATEYHREFRFLLR